MMHGAEKTSLPAPMQIDRQQYTRDRLAIAAAIEADRNNVRAPRRPRKRRTLAAESAAVFTIEEAYRLLSNAPEHPEELKSDEIAPATIPAAAAPQSGRQTRVMEYTDNIGECLDPIMYAARLRNKYEARIEREEEAQEKIQEERRRMNPKVMINKEVQTSLKALPAAPTDSSILYN